MNAKRRGGGSGRLVWLVSLSRLVHGQAPRVMAVVGVLVAFCAGGYVAWQRWNSAVVEHPKYLLSADRIETTPQPPWIRADVKAEVVRDGQLSGLSLLEPEATVKIARAFEAHTWVAHVQRVTKRPAFQATVDLQYRRPIAMVVVADGYWPVDTTGKLLPPAEFAPSQAADYLQIVGANSQPAGPAGTAYGDRRVEGGAAIATLLDADWRELNLQRIVARQASSGPSHAEPEFDLFTRRGVRVIWGHAPGHEAPAERNAFDKRAYLLEHVRVNGPLDAPGGVVDLDLRRVASDTTPRTANLHEPAER